MVLGTVMWVKNGIDRARKIVTHGIDRARAAKLLVISCTVVFMGLEAPQCLGEPNLITRI
jgi:hypothetical protein